jgi:quercetin dioxygenase-like cupin family protein
MEPGIARSRLDPTARERFVTLRRQLGVTSFGINQLVLEPRQRGRIHRHARHEEVYLVLEGTLTLLVEGEEHVLERGELIRVAPELRRQLVNRGPERLVLLAARRRGRARRPRRRGVHLLGGRARRASAGGALPEDLPVSAT